MKKIVLSSNESRVLSVIPRGADNPILIDHITNMVGIERRSVQSIIETLITRYNIPIVSIRGGLATDKKGVYIATNDRERQEGLSSLKSQVGENIKRIKCVEQADLENWENGIYYQIELFKEKAAL